MGPLKLRGLRKASRPARTSRPTHPANSIPLTLPTPWIETLCLRGFAEAARWQLRTRFAGPFQRRARFLAKVANIGLRFPSVETLFFFRPLGGVWGKSEYGSPLSHLLSQLDTYLGL